MTRHTPRILVAVVAAAMLFALLTNVHRERAARRAQDDVQSIIVVQWNVENLFDADDDPANPGDDEFTPPSWRRWDDRRYHRKLDHLADVLAQLNGDIVCLEEVENRRVLEDLNHAIAKRTGHAYPHILHREGPDHRGIDVAMLTRFTPLDVRWLTPLPDQREILVARMAPGGHELTVMACHWKSRYGGAEETAPQRATLGDAMRGVVDAILEASPDAVVLLAGDFNDDITDPSIAEHLRSVTDRKAVQNDPAGRLLYNLDGELPPEARGSFYYHGGKSWNTFDSMSVTRAALDATSAGWTVKPGSYGIFRTPETTLDDGTPKAFRRVYDKETKRRPYQEGYSDHFPVHVTLTRPEH